MFPSPTRMFLTKGIGVHRHALTAFEFALRDADIEQQNLVYVSSILPPHCEVISREAGVEILKPGDITFCVLARSETNEFGRRIYASLGLARPADPEMYGYISELHGYGMTAAASGEQAEDLAATMLASTLGLDFDPDAAWNDRKQIYEHSSVIIDSTSITAVAECGPDNLLDLCGCCCRIPVFLRVHRAEPEHSVIADRGAVEPSIRQSSWAQSRHDDPSTTPARPTVRARRHRPTPRPVRSWPTPPAQQSTSPLRRSWCVPTVA